MLIGISGRKQHGKDTVCKIIQYLTDPNTEKENLSYEEYWPWVKGQYQFGYHHNWQRKIFAGKLKETVALMIGCSVQDLENEEFKNKPLGKEWVRYIPKFFDPIFNLYIRERLSFLTEQEARKNFSHADLIEITELTPRMILQELGTEGLRGIHPNFHVNALFANYKAESYKPTEGLSLNYRYPNWIIPDVRFPNEIEAIKKRGGLVIRVENPRIESNDTHASETSLDSFKDWDWKILNDGTIDDLINKVRDFLYTKNLV